jgi:hypothetical protein
MIIKRPQIAHIPPYSPPLWIPPPLPPLLYPPYAPVYMGYDAVQKISGEKMIKKKKDAIFQKIFSGKFFGFKKRGCHISKNFFWEISRGNF